MGTMRDEEVRTLAKSIIVHRGLPAADAWVLADESIRILDDMRRQEIKAREDASKPEKKT